MFHLALAAAINPDAAREMTDHLLDLAEERQFDIQHDAWLFHCPSDPHAYDEDLAAAHAQVKALSSLDHRPLRMVAQRRLQDLAEQGDRDAGDELTFRAGGAREHHFGDARRAQAAAYAKRNALLAGADLPC